MTPKCGRPAGVSKPQAGWEELRLAVMKQAVSDHRQAKYMSGKALIERWILTNMDLGTICAYAIHDSMGRESFVPDTIRSIVTPLLPELPDKTLRMMREHCLWQRRSESWGCQKGEWIKWAKAVDEECRRRGI